MKNYLLSVLLACMSSTVFAQVLITDVDVTIRLVDEFPCWSKSDDCLYDPYPILYDINQDGVDDFRYRLNIGDATCQEHVVEQITPALSFSEEVLGEEDVIDETLTWNTFHWFIRYGGFFDTISSPFQESGKYLGVRLELDGAVHYGWVEIFIETTDSVLEAKTTIKRFGFNQTPEAGLTSKGELTSVEDLLENGISLYTAQNQLFIKQSNSSNEPLTIQVYDMTGKSVLRRSISTPSASIPINTSGVYLLRLQRGTQVWKEKVMVR